jgi:thioredoxin reductase
LAKQLGVKMKDGEIIVSGDMSTSVAGVYAAGDVISGGFKQAITAAAQGVTAVSSAYDYLKK